MALQESNSKLSRGDSAPEFNLKSANSKALFTLKHIKEIRNPKLYLIVFMCNHCPYVKAKFNELNRIYQDFKEKGVVVIGINSNSSVSHPEDSFENMQSLVADKTITYLYLHDETQETAKAYGAVCTPDPFLFDENQKLIFHSRIDNPPGLQPAEKNEMYDAISEYLKTGKITMEESASMGCSIKWK